jgi:hypothetical protein
MYYAVVATFMVVLPLLSIFIEAGTSHAALGALLACKWFVFWAMGWRLLLAGIRQIAQPAFTAREILGLKGEESHLLVRELGFANVAMGLLGVASLAQPGWRAGAALTGGAFYALAGANHVLRAHRNRLENVAMLSDLFVAAVLLASGGAILIAS